MIISSRSERTFAHSVQDHSKQKGAVRLFVFPVFVVIINIMIGTLLQANNFAHLLSYWSFGCAALYILLLLLKTLRPEMVRVRYGVLHGGYVVVKVIYGLLLSLGQYVHWAGNPFTKPLTTLPLPTDVPLPGMYRLFHPLLELPHGYFLDYMLSRYWFSFLWGLLAALLVLGLLRMLRRARPHLLSILDINVFFAGGLLLSWPSVLLFILIVFGIFFVHVCIATARGAGRVPLYPSVIFALIITLVFGERLAGFLPFIDILRFSRS